MESLKNKNLVVRKTSDAFRVDHWATRPNAFAIPRQKAQWIGKKYERQQSMTKKILLTLKP